MWVCPSGCQLDQDTAIHCQTCYFGQFRSRSDPDTHHQVGGEPTVVIEHHGLNFDRGYTTTEMEPHAMFPMQIGSEHGPAETLRRIHSFLQSTTNPTDRSDGPVPATHPGQPPALHS